jgi:hypothetical protein
MKIEDLANYRMNIHWKEKTYDRGHSSEIAAPKAG